MQQKQLILFYLRSVFPPELQHKVSRNKSYWQGHRKGDPVKAQSSNAEIPVA